MNFLLVSFFCCNFAAQLCARMKLLLLILSVMTWTVTSKSSVTGDGEWPYDIEVGYSCTYQKGDVCKDDVATLILDNLGGIAVESIKVYVNSNKDSGAGTFTVTGNGQKLATKSGTFKDWVGKYDNSQFYPIEVLSGFHRGLTSLSIELKGTANSLHIEKYVITFQMPPAYSVTLMKGNDIYNTLKETQGGGGVVLPNLPDENKWHFLGWSEVEFWTLYTEPTLIPANTTYHPAKDVSLWAVFQMGDTISTDCVTDLQSGDYLYVETTNNIAISGTPADGVLAVSAINVFEENQWYHLELNATGDSATLRHVKTGVYIGYSGTKIVENANIWCVWHENDRTALYMTKNGTNYVLFPNMAGEHGGTATLYSTKYVSTSPTGLVPAVREKPAVLGWTCHPESELDIVAPKADAQEYMLQIGNYQLRIKDGKKYIQIEQ